MILPRVGILFYNCILWLLAHRLISAPGRRVLLALSWVQILLDLGCLTVVTVHTGGLASPALGFFVFHMVFASLLLPQAMAFGGAALAAVMMSGGLLVTRRWPETRGDQLLLLGWIVTLLLTVYLANHITRRLRRQRRRLVFQNRRIRGMSKRLWRQQQAMIQHEKMAALGQMAAGVAHEIANPLASMGSLLDLFQRHPERIKAESVHSLREQVDRINQIIQQMKTFAHPGETERQTLPLNDVVEGALRMVRYDARIARVQVDRQLSPSAAAVRVRPRALQQVLVNLILNSLDAMADVPKPQLTLQTGCGDGWCTVQIRDNGHGIRPEHMDQLFEPFFTTKPVGKGTGLGLSVSYALVRRLGGRIEVQSQPGQGASFTIHLPAGGPAGVL